MNYTLESAVDKLLSSYKAYYDIIEVDDEYLCAICEFYERSEKYVLSKKAELWSANCEEFIFLYKVPHLTQKIFEKCKECTIKDGMKKANIGPGHMYTYITPVIVCEGMDDDVIKSVKKSRFYKSFQFSMHGWMDLHLAVINVTDNKIITNASGKCVEKVLKKVLLQEKRRRLI